MIKTMTVKLPNGDIIIVECWGCEKVGTCEKYCDEEGVIKRWEKYDKDFENIEENENGIKVVYE